jgi:hypothetical protein
MMLSTLVPAKTVLHVPSDGSDAAPATRTYRTNTSFVAAHFDQAGKGRIVFLPKAAILRVVGPSSCLPEGFEVVFENQTYNVFGIDLLGRSSLIHETSKAKCRAVAACA